MPSSLNGSTASFVGGEMHVSGRNRGIVELDLGSVFTSDEERQALSMVKSLDLSYNALRDVSALQALAQLRTLDLSRNKIRSICGLPLSITRLDVSHNDLASVEGIVLLPCLAELDVSNNKITSLQLLSKITSLQVLRANGNRIAHASGLEFLSSLRLLALEHNYLASADDLLFLSSLPCLESVSFRGSPITNINGYRELVAKLQRNVCVLDGSPLVSGGAVDGPSRVDDVSAVLSRGASSRPSTADSLAGRGANFEPKRRSVLINELRGPSLHGNHNDEDDDDDDDAQRAVEAVRRRTEQLAHEKEELQEQVRSVTKQLHQTLIMLDNEQRESSRLRSLNTKLEQQLSDARRVISDEVRELAVLRQEREELVDTVTTLRSRLDKANRTAKYSYAKFQSEASKMAMSIERERAVHDVEMSDLRCRIGENIRRAADRSTKYSSSTAHNASSSSRTAARRNDSTRARTATDLSAVDVTSSTLVASPDRGSGSDSGEERRGGHRSDLAGQLKSWLLTEMEKSQHAAGNEQRLIKAAPLDSESEPQHTSSNAEVPGGGASAAPFVASQRPASAGGVQPRRTEEEEEHINAIRRSKKAAKDISAIWMRNEQILRQ